MKRLMKVPVFILVLFLGVFLSGCNNQTEQPDKSDQNDSAQKQEIAVYYLKSTDQEIYLVREVHQVEKTTEVAQAALNELIKGDPITPDAYRVLPEDTRILGINIDNGLATVDFSPEVLRANVGSSGEGLGIASIVNTLTEFPTIQ
ncbi:MAG: GerMN domain-containing protein, partial [Bacillota bacterium]|nr:GerMN domain-containing protein [Bacillota bacterium]